MRPRGKVHCRCPEPVTAGFHRNRSLLPFCKIANQKNALGLRGDKAKGLFLKSFCCFCHRLLFFSGIRRAADADKTGFQTSVPCRRHLPSVRSRRDRTCVLVPMLSADGHMSKRTYSQSSRNPAVIRMSISGSPVLRTTSAWTKFLIIPPVHYVAIATCSRNPGIRFTLAL
jgi:hypothetical protein